MSAKRNLLYSTNTLALAIVLFVILVIINGLSKKAFKRLDLTESKRYTISKSTKKLLGQLDDIVRVEAYFSEAPDQVKLIKDEVKDMLDEYDAFASGNLQIEFINPTEDDDLKQKLRMKGIPEIQVQVREKDKIEVRNAYMGLAVVYGDKQEVIPVIQKTTTLEYDLTSAILKTTRKETKTVGFLEGHDEVDIYGQGFENLRKELGKQYTLRKIDVSQGSPIEGDVSTLIVAGPQSPLQANEKYEIDQFLMNGGKIVFLVDAVKMAPGSIQASPLSTGLTDLLSHYGIQLGNNLVQDISHDNLTYSQGGFMTITRPYPFFIKVLKSYQYSTGSTSEGFPADSVATSGLDSLVLPWSTSLSVVAKEGVSTTIMAKTSNQAWTAQAPYNLDPTRMFTPPSSVKNSYPVAVLLAGEFTSFYAGKEIPSASNADGEEDTENKNKDRKTVEKSPPTQIVVVGTSQFLRQPRVDGMTFFQNSIDYITLGSSLIGIRSKQISDRSFKTDPSTFARLAIKVLCIGAIPLLVALFGLFRFFSRMRAKRMVETYGRV
ncbi:MAG: Gldg family protein [Candidatus Poribacteria bacterium]|nr:Gldg family protein [Candidatus Poribacteria bacterium]